jgi:hypothetical protein
MTRKTNPADIHGCSCSLSQYYYRTLVGRFPYHRGNVVVFTALLMVVLIGMLAFAVDTGYIVHVRTELQRTADAGALAAAALLPDQSAATAAVDPIATRNGWSNQVGIEFGYWNRDTAMFAVPPPASRDPNAVRVTLHKSQAAGNAVGLFFGRVFGKDSVNASASATAIYDRWLCGPFVGIQSATALGTPRTDSYNSQEGGYAWGTRNHGSICSDGPINVEGTAVIRGDVRAGKGFTPTLEGTVTVTGSVGSRSEPLNLPPVDATQAATTNDNRQIPLIPRGNGWVSPVDGNGNFLLDGNKVINMPPGTYYFKNFTLSGQSIFNVYGPTTIYITGNLMRAGGTQVNNFTQIPANLKILMTGGTASVTSNNNFFGVIYAPNTPVIVDGSSDYFGAIVGKTLTITGSGAGHYDESLQMDEIEFPRRTALVD